MYLVQISFPLIHIIIGRRIRTLSLHVYCGQASQVAVDFYMSFSPHQWNITSLYLATRSARHKALNAACQERKKFSHRLNNSSSWSFQCIRPESRNPSRAELKIHLGARKVLMYPCRRFSLYFLFVFVFVSLPQLKCLNFVHPTLGEQEVCATVSPQI